MAEMAINTQIVVHQQHKNHNKTDTFQDISGTVEKNITLGRQSWFDDKWASGWKIDTPCMILTAMATALWATGKFVAQAIGTVTGIMPLIGMVQDFNTTHAGTTSTEEGSHTVTNTNRSFGYLIEMNSVSSRSAMQAYNQRVTSTLNHWEDYNFSSLSDLQDFFGNSLQSISGTFAALAHVNGKKVVVTQQTGSSSLWLVKNDGTVGKLTNSSQQWGVFAVEKGDRIIGVTASASDQLSDSALESILRGEKDAQGIIRRCKDETSGATNNLSAFVLHV